MPDAVTHFFSAFVDALDKAHRTGGIPLPRATSITGRIEPSRRCTSPTTRASRSCPCSMVSIAVEKRAKSLRDATIREKAPNPFHLIRREAVSFANLKTFVPCSPFGRSLFCHGFSLRRLVSALSPRHRGRPNAALRSYATPHGRLPDLRGRPRCPSIAAISVNPKNGAKDHKRPSLRLSSRGEEQSLTSTTW